MILNNEERSETDHAETDGPDAEGALAILAGVTACRIINKMGSSEFLKEENDRDLSKTGRLVNFVKDYSIVGVAAVAGYLATGGIGGVATSSALTSFGMGLIKPEFRRGERNAYLAGMVLGSSVALIRAGYLIFGGK